MASVAAASSTQSASDSTDLPPAPRVNTAAAQGDRDARIRAVHSSPVRSLVSKFEKKPEQSLDALPFRTVRSFFGDADERSIHVTAEKQKYDALTEKQRAEAEARRLQRSPEVSARKRVATSPVNRVTTKTEDDEDEKKQQVASTNQAVVEEPTTNEAEEEEETVPAVMRKLETEFDDESTDVLEEHGNQQESNGAEEEIAELLAPPPPPPPPSQEQQDAPVPEERKQFVNTPEQETKKRPILTTERSFVMEDDHTIETEDLVVVGERFSTDGEDDREMLLELLERELQMSPEQEAELREALKSNTSQARMIRRAYKYKRPENVPSKLFAPTAASLASRTTKSPSAVKREPKKATPTAQTTAAAASAATTPARKTNKYANVQSKVKKMMKPTTPTKASRRRASDASDISHTSSRSSMGGGRTPSKASTTASQQHNGASSADRRSSMTSTKSSRRSSVNRTLLDIHDEEAHSDWENRHRHRSERLSFASSTSSTDSTDPFALQLSYSTRKSRYDNVQPRYLDYSKQSATYARNKEAQLERRRKLEEANAAKSAERQKQLQFQLKLKEKREKEDLEMAVRRGEELHKMTMLLKEKEKEEETERRKSQSATRRALSGTGSADTPSAGRRGGTPSSSSVGASSPRTSLLSEPDSIPSSAASGATANAVIAA